MIFLNLIKSDDEMWIETRKFSIFGKKTQRLRPQNQKSLNLDQDLRKNH